MRNIPGTIPDVLDRLTALEKEVNDAYLEEDNDDERIKRLRPLIRERNSLHDTLAMLAPASALQIIRDKIAKYVTAKELREMYNKGIFGHVSPTDKEIE